MLVSPVSIGQQSISRTEYEALSDLYLTFTTCWYLDLLQPNILLAMESYGLHHDADLDLVLDRIIQRQEYWDKLSKGNRRTNGKHLVSGRIYVHNFSCLLRSAEKDIIFTPH